MFNVRNVWHTLISALVTQLFCGRVWYGNFFDNKGHINDDAPASKLT